MEPLSYVIVGGGVSAVSCARELRAFDEEGAVTLISASPLLKAIKNRTPVGQLLQSFDIAEEAASTTFSEEENVNVIRGKVTKWNAKDKFVTLDDGRQFRYDKLCIATGGRPKGHWSHPLVISIRDTETVERLSERMKGAKRIVVVGNGGIATEIVYELKNVEIVWAIKHSSISATFFDEGAAEFFKPMLMTGHQNNPQQEPLVSKRFKITVEQGRTHKSDISGCALGPDWTSVVDITGSMKERSVHVIYNVRVNQVHGGDNKPRCCKDSEFYEGDWPLFVELTDGQMIGCDLLVQATGVRPNSDFWKSQCDELLMAEDGGILVNDKMMSSVDNVYACGDVCTANWQWAKHWMQMRLWTQAYQMGAYCGRAMTLPDIGLDFCFELFTHVTTFFGFKVIFLGRFNGEDVEKPWHALMRITKGREYIKLIVHNGRLQGAVLVGETHLEETIENLILNEIDVTDVEEGLLDPEIEIDDYFD